MKLVNSCRRKASRWRDSVTDIALLYCGIKAMERQDGNQTGRGDIDFIYDQIVWLYVDTKQSSNPITASFTQFKSI